MVPEPTNTRKQEELHKKPIIPPKSINDILAQVIGDPLCHKSGCHGKGFIGIVPTKDGPMMIPCSCGRFVRNDYVRIVEEIRDSTLLLAGLIDRHFQALQLDLASVKRHTFYGGMKHRWVKIFGTGRPKP